MVWGVSRGQAGVVMVLFPPPRPGKVPTQAAVVSKWVVPRSRRTGSR